LRPRRCTTFHLRRMAFALLGFALQAAAAQAAGWHYYDPECPIALGEKTMKFVAMQPKKNIDRVCDALPDTGPTVIALDAADAELREMIWDIRVLKDKETGVDGQGADGETVFQLPAQKHRNGMANFDHTFVDAGKYVLLVQLTSDGGEKNYVGRHHFTVGLLDATEFYAYVGFALFVVVVGGSIGFTAWKKRSTSS
jgi:hypothetical protein